MILRSSRLLAVVAGSVLAVHAVPSAFAQTEPAQDSTVHPITLPAPDAPRPAAHRRARRKAAPAAAATQVTTQDQVHPITSLPRPAAEADASAVPVASQDHYVKPSHADAAPAVQPAIVTSAPLTATPVSEETSSSSAVNSPAAPAPEPAAPAQPASDPAPIPLHMRNTMVQALPAGGSNHIRPFSAVGVQLKIGFNGPGVDIAVPLAQHWNARVGGTFFQYSGTYTIDGVDISGEAKFRSGNFALDYFPFKGTFRISPGITFYNGNHVQANASIPGGNTFTLNDVNYTSAVNDPVRGTATLSFGNRRAPSITAGWGNMIPRHGSRFSVPFEFGIQYISDPKIDMVLAGTACSAQGTVSGCGQLQSDPIAQDNLAKELKKLNDQIHPLAYYPILSIGVSWSFASRNH